MADSFKKFEEDHGFDNKHPKKLFLIKFYHVDLIINTLRNMNTFCCDENQTLQRLLLDCQGPVLMLGIQAFRFIPWMPEFNMASSPLDVKPAFDNDLQWTEEQQQA